MSSDPTGPRASVGARIGAFLVDGILLGAATALAVAVLGEVAGTAAGIALALAYFAWLEGKPAGQTIGKRLLRIRVIAFADGGSLDTRQAWVRSALRFVDTTVAVGLIVGLVDGEKQAWHDMGAQTVVVPTSSYPVPGGRA